MADESFEQQVAVALIQHATDRGRVQIGVMENHIQYIAPWIAAAIEAAAIEADSEAIDSWEQSRQAALTALRGGDA